MQQMPIDAKSCLDYFSKLEAEAQEILLKKKEIVDLSKKSNGLREAKRALESEMKKYPSNSKTWLCFGNIFIKCSKPKALSIVEKDHNTLEGEINEVRNHLRSKVQHMRQLEGKPDLMFDLKPLDKDELKAMKTILSNVSDLS